MSEVIVKILIVEDDAEMCKRYGICINRHTNMKAVGYTNSSQKAITSVKEFYPHVVILDLELHAGSGNGIEFLTALKTLKLSRNPYIIVATNNSSRRILEFSRQLGVDFIFSKHESDFSEDKVIDFIETLRPILNERPVFSVADSSDGADSPAQIRKERAAYISNELVALGITPKLKGYGYLIDAIVLVAENRNCDFSRQIAQKNNKTPASVERAMQNAIIHAWNYGDIDELEKHYTARFSPNKTNPTLMEFVCYYADAIVKN